MATQTITVLFTDLVASTELLSRVGEARADELRREHFGLLRGAIALQDGREVKNLGDGLMVAFEGVGPALGCAVAMQQAISGRPPGSEPLAIRIGLAVGEAEAEDDDFFGLPVVEAARLCAKAQGGEILTTDFVRMLARSRGGFDLESVGALELKGLAEPVDTYRVRWEPATSVHDDAVPVSRRVLSLASGAFVGRARERERLEDALKAAETGIRRAVLLAGEPGIGKTALAAHFAVGASGRGATVLYGRCNEDLFVPYQPWVEALGYLVEHAPEELLGDHVALAGAVLGRLVPELRRRFPSGVTGEGSGDVETDRHLLLGAVVNLLARASATRPLVLLLDDLHWADAASVQMLRYVLASSTDLHIVVIGTFRSSEIGPDHVLADVLAKLHREPGVERLTLGGLGDDDLLELLQGIAGHEMTDDGLALRDTLLAETDGNPFFVGELLRHLSETGAIYRDDQGQWAASVDLRATGLPVSIKEVVARRVGALGEEAHRVLSMASVIGRDFEVGLLGRVVDLDVDHLIDLCDEAVGAAILRETEHRDGYTFAHALIEYTLYDEMSVTRRSRAHGAIAEAIEALWPDQLERWAGQLAYHWTNATRPEHVAKAIAYGRLAGDRALAKLAPEDALRAYTDALTLLDQGEHRSREALEIRIRVGEARRLTGDPSYRDALVEVANDAITEGEPEVLVAAALVGDRGYNANAGFVDEPFVGVVRAARDAVGEGDSRDRARLCALLATELAWQQTAPDERLALVEEALAMARRLGDDRTFAEVVANGDESRAIPERAEANLRDTLAATAAADRVGNLALRIRARTTAASAAIDCADRDTFDELLPVLQSDAEKMDHPDFEVSALFHRLHGAELDGDPHAAAAAAGRYDELQTQAGAPANALLVRSSAMVMVGAMRGDLALCVPALEDAIVGNPAVPTLRSLLAWALAVGHREPECRASMVADRANGFVVAHNEAWMSQVYWTEAAARLGDVEAMVALLPRIERWTHLMGFSQGITGFAIAHYAGSARHSMGDLDLAVAHHQQALAIHERLRAPFHVAWSQVALAAVLTERGRDADLARARSTTEAALATATERGYGYVQRDAETLTLRLAAAR